MSFWAGLDARPIPRACAFGILGILNITPDSFYDGGQHESPVAALGQARKLLQSGADVLDIGAESTRPGSIGIGPDEECRRLLPALRKIRQELPDAVISVDTRHAHTARLALEHGCQIINDVSGLRHDPALLEIIAAYKPGYVLMHSQGEPATMQKRPLYGNVVSEVKAFFGRELERLARAGLPEDRIALDPGIGFGKTAAHNLELIRHCAEFLEFGRPLLFGISMKGFLAKICGEEKRGLATAVLSALLFARGVVWHRLHRPEEVRPALLLAEAT